MNNYNSPSQLRVSNSEINQFIDEVVTMVADCCDVINENGKKTLKIKEKFEENGIYKSSNFAYKKKDPKERHYRDMMMCDNQEIVFNVTQFTKNVIGITTPINKKHGNGYCVFHLHCGQNLLTQNKNVPKYRFSIRDYCGKNLTQTIGLDNFIDKILEKKEEKKKEKNKNNNVMQEEEKKEDLNLKSNDDLLKYINGSSDDNKDKEKKGQTAGQKKTKKRQKKREEELKKKQIAEEQKKLEEEKQKEHEEDRKKQKQELERQRQFKNKWRRMKESVVDAKIKDTKEIVNNLKNNQMKKNAEQKIKDMAIKKNKNTFTNNLKTTATDTKKYLQQEKYRKSFRNYVEKTNYIHDNKKIPVGLAAAQQYYYSTMQSQVNNSNNQTQNTPLNLDSKPFIPNRSGY